MSTPSGEEQSNCWLLHTVAQLSNKPPILQPWDTKVAGVTGAGVVGAGGGAVVGAGGGAGGGAGAASMLHAPANPAKEPGVN